MRIRHPHCMGVVEGTEREVPIHPLHRLDVVGAMRQRILGSHTPPCHARMVITTLSSMFCLAALQRRLDQCQMLPHMRHSRWLSNVLWLSGSARSHHPPTAPVSL